MDILFKKKKDMEICNNDKLLRKEFKGNSRMCKQIKARLDELADADNLEVMRFIPMSYCHELKGDRKGQLAVKLDQGCRMIFEPANEPAPRKSDGGLDWTQITSIRILKISEDYHD
ncbi:MAG: killer suppression protein [Desulfobacterium sp.]|nr:killer suppression protein [Desulfobacterium sp.]